MFGKSRRLAEETLANETFKTFIDASTTVEGRMTFESDVRIDGRIIGDVAVQGGATGLVAVGPDAEVRGDVSAHRVLVAGAVRGNIHAVDAVQLLAGARVSGDITYGSIAIVRGARVNGLLIDLAKDTTGTSASSARPGAASGLDERSAA